MERDAACELEEFAEMLTVGGRFLCLRNRFDNAHL